MNTQRASAAVVESDPVGRLEAGYDRAQARRRHKEEERPQERQVSLGAVQAHLLDLPLDPGDHDLKGALPARYRPFGD